MNNEEISRPKDLFSGTDIKEKKTKAESVEEAEEAKEYYWVKNDKVYLKSIVPLVEKYRDMWNAVYIDPNSWFDKKLKDAYNEDSHQQEEED